MRKLLSIHVDEDLPMYACVSKEVIEKVDILPANLLPITPKNVPE